MREFSILLIPLLFNFSSAQTYHFNLVTKYTSSDVKDKILRDHVQNNYTDDFSYYLESLKWNSELTTRIDDMERNLLHYFSVEEIKQGSEVQFEFTYLTSIRLTGQRISKKYRYDFTANSLQELTLKIYNLKKKKEPCWVSILTLKKSNKNLIPIYTMNLLSKNSGYSHWNNFGYYFVSKTIHKSFKGVHESNLMEYKNDDFKIILAKKLKFNR